MVAFVMFWAALFAMCFFIAGTLFKALASAIQVLLNFAVRLMLFVILFMVAVLGVSAVYEIIAGFTKGSVGSAILHMVIIIVLAVIVIGIVGGLGAAVLGIIISVSEKVSHIVSFVLEGLAAICEKGYAKSLNSILKRIEKC